MHNLQKIQYTKRLPTWIASCSMLLIQEMLRNLNHYLLEDLEFYHDKGGLTNYEHTISFMKEVAKNNNGLRRDLVKGSLEVYPIPGYGAMEIGVHTFCHLENGKQRLRYFLSLFIYGKRKMANGKLQE